MKKTKKNIKQKKYTKRYIKQKKYGGTPKIERLNTSRKNVSSILERIKKTQDASRANMQKMFRYIKGESLQQYDIGQAENPDPVYDLGQAEHPDPVYDLGQAKSGSPVYDLGQAKSGSPIYDLGQAKSGSPIYDLGQADEEPTGQTSMDKLDITAGSWDFYTLKIVDSQPRTEKELCEIMKVKFPERITGKTPCNTLNKVLQTLVKHGYISRIAFKTKGTQKRENYKYFKKDVPSKTDYIEIMPKSIEQETPIQDESTLSEPSETFKLIVKKVLDKNKIYTRDDLIKFCNGSDRTKLYDAVKKECPPRKCDGKHFKSIVRKTYEELLSGFKLYKVSKV